ncbi:MAG: fibro-slime domain-containing protein, partial [Chitinivibrionales bacterium]|nr:fibro-slime domain-containing protein [Chitinivibrionales bacterium]
MRGYQARDRTFRQRSTGRRRRRRGRIRGPNQDRVSEREGGITMVQNQLLKRFAYALSMLAFLFLFVQRIDAAYILTDTLMQQVIFYDFHADGSNPNFEPSGGCGNTKGMVQDTLDADRKPVLKADVCYNDRIAEWWRPSGRPPGTRFVYDPVRELWSWSSGTLKPYGTVPGDSVGIDFAPGYDMANVVIHDSLPFILVDSATGSYNFTRPQSTGFFWLDGRGFGEEPAGRGHNYGFAMELHHEFTYIGGEYFQFSGDDGVWVYINDRLVVDLGGMQKEVKVNLDVDALASTLGMTQGNRYMFDFFYTERKTSQASAIITTNILTPTKPDDLIITTGDTPPAPGDTTAGLSDTTITAGDCVTLHAWVIDDTSGFRPEWDSLVQWEVIDTVGNDISYDTVAASNEFCLIRAYGCVAIYVTFNNPDFPGITLNDSIILCIAPGPASQIVAEATPPSPTSRDAAPIDTLTIASTESDAFAYAVLRDQYGNYVDVDGDAVWQVLPGGDGVVSVTNGDPALGQGLITKRSGPGVPTGGSDRIVVTGILPGGATVSDTFTVTVLQTEYVRIRLASGEGGMRTDIDSVYLTLGLDTLLYAEGLRADGLGWDLIPAAWTLTGVSASEAPPASRSFWTFTPADTGSGRIMIAFDGMHDTMGVRVDPGAPAALALFPDTGMPGGVNSAYLSPHANTYSRRAGQPIPLAAKLFDAFGTWLATYERDPGKADRFSWEARFAGSGALVPATVGQFSATIGPFVSFTAYETRHTIDLIVRFTEGVYTYRDTMRIYVTPGYLLHLVIEPSADSNLSPHDDNPINMVQLLPSDTLRDVFAILRDQFGNFARYADAAVWESGDSSLVGVRVGAQQWLGHGVIARADTCAGRTYVHATEGPYTDSVLVEIESITYTGLRIVTTDGGFRDIDTLIMRTDQDTTLFALGRRSDNGQWVYVPVVWSQQALDGAVSPPLEQVDRWAFSPAAVDTGTIRIDRDGITDQIVAIFLHGAPMRLTLYDGAGSPTNATPFPEPPTVDTLTAGETVTIAAKLFDHMGAWLSEYETADSLFRWGIDELAGAPPTGTIGTTTGAVTQFTPTRAYNLVEVTAEFTQGTVTLSGSVRFYVVPAPGTQLVIEATPDRHASPHASNPINTVTISSDDTVAYAYAIIRDEFGNYVAPAVNVTWASLAPAVVGARIGVAANGEGVFSRLADGGTAEVVATSLQGGITLRDTVMVIVSDVQYDSLRIVNSAAVDVDTLRLRTDQSAMLHALGRRSDNGEWDEVAVTWRAEGVATDPPPATQVSAWRVTPAGIDTGVIVISMTSGGQTHYDTAVAEFTHGLPARLILFPMPGTPYSGANQPLPPPTVTDTVIAGTHTQFVAKVFDHRDVWLSEYESAGAPFVWSQLPVPGGAAITDTVSPRTGYSTALLPYDAHRTMYIVAEFTRYGIVLRDTVRVHVAVSPDGHHMVIEADPDMWASPNDDNPVFAVTLSSRDTITTVHAIIRDRYGNWVDYSRATYWGSLDTTIVEARDGAAELGEGAVVRVAETSSATRVFAYDLAEPTLTDTIHVNVNDVIYDSLRIVVNAQGLTDVDTVMMRTDQDTTLQVLGRRSDTRRWVNVRVPWTVAGVETDPAAPALGDTWHFTPLRHGTGTATVSYVDSAGDVITDRVVLVFTPGPPERLVIYPQPGQPGVNSNLPYPPHTTVDTVTAGDTLPLVAKVFDHLGVWLSQFETTDAPISWRVVELQGNVNTLTGSLYRSSGAVSSYVPLRAFNTVYVIATFTDGGFADTVAFHVMPDTVTHLVLEASPDPGVSPHDDNPLESLTVGTRDTIANVYAVLRDRFGNFVGYPRSADWRSDDTTLVHAGPGIATIGEGRIVRNADTGGTTFVVAWEHGKPWLRDSVPVTLATITYDSLRIVRGNVPIDSLIIETDDLC